jgi:hypothetical protein
MRILEDDEAELRVEMREREDEEEDEVNKYLLAILSV